MDTQERRVSIYPTPSYYKLLIAFAKDNEQGKSKLPTHLLEEFFDKMDEEEKARLRRLFHNMSAEERRRYIKKEKRR